jgi:uncharacterized protein
LTHPAPVSFPEFKTVEMSDGDFIREKMRAIGPLTSEMTFTNLFMWLNHYRFEWSFYGDCLLVLSRPLDGDPYFLPPIGPCGRREAATAALEWLRREKGIASPKIERADPELAAEFKTLEHAAVEPQRDHYDYVYNSQDLITLAGRKFHDKKNHINRFARRLKSEYVPFTGAHADECLMVVDKWCDNRECDKHPVLKAETEAVKQALRHFDALQIQGGAILINGRIEAFTFGEMLNRDTAVIHAEKADIGIPELFAVINQQFCEKQWASVPFINREQDLGLAGLRRAKLSYNPVRLIEKFRIILR